MIVYIGVYKVVDKIMVCSNVNLGSLGINWSTGFSKVFDYVFFSSIFSFASKRSSLCAKFDLENFAKFRVGILQKLEIGKKDSCFKRGNGVR